MLCSLLVSGYDLENEVHYMRRLVSGHGLKNEVFNFTTQTSGDSNGLSVVDDWNTSIRHETWWYMSVYLSCSQWRGLIAEGPEKVGSEVSKVKAHHVAPSSDHCWSSHLAHPNRWRHRSDRQTKKQTKTDTSPTKPKNYVIIKTECFNQMSRQLSVC